MPKNHTISASMALAMGLGLLLALLRVLSSRSPVVQAQGPDGYSTYYAAPSCNGVPAPCYTTVQAAVDAADDPADVIKVAAGTYTDLNNHGGLVQVGYINKTVTIRGGYTTAFTDPPDPDANPTTLDADGQGRVIYITGDISPTLEGLHITGGNATGPGGTPWGSDVGGGVYVYRATATISDCLIYSNTAGTAESSYGGGLWLRGSNATLSGNTVSSNTAQSGGGLYVLSGDAILNDNIITTNTARDHGGGLRLSAGYGTLNDNTITANTASSGGGLYMYSRGGAPPPG